MSQLEAQMRQRDVDMVPKVLVRAMFAVMLGALALVSFAVLTDRPKEGVLSESPVVAERIVTLAMGEGDAVRVIAEDGAVVARSDEDKSGFISVVWRVVERERLRHSAAPGPVRVVRRANGRTAVIDPSTGWSVDLIGYGRDNIAAFARLVEEG